MTIAWPSAETEPLTASPSGPVMNKSWAEPTDQTAPLGKRRQGLLKGKGQEI